MNKRRKHRGVSLPKLITLILLIVAIFTNPSKEDFYGWANNKAIEESQSVVEGALKNLFVSPLLKSVTVRKNFILFSTYTIEIDQNSTVYLGVFDSFFEFKDS